MFAFMNIRCSWKVGSFSSFALNWICHQVNLLEAMETMDRETFEFRFGEELVYTTMLSDGQMVDLVPGGSNVAVRYEDRSEFIRLVQKARLEESKLQVREQVLKVS